MSGYVPGRRCDTCGGESPRAPTCGECEVSARYEAKLEAAEARGYARAVADVVAWHRAKAENASEPCEHVWDVHEACAVDITNGAHVGAAKKEGA